MSSLYSREQRGTETWPQAFQRRLEDGTAWTTGWTEEEVARAESDDQAEIDQLIAEAVFDSDGYFESGPYTLHEVFPGEILVYKWIDNVAVLVRDQVRR